MIFANWISLFSDNPTPTFSGSGSKLIEYAGKAAKGVAHKKSIIVNAFNKRIVKCATVST